MTGSTSSNVKQDNAGLGFGFVVALLVMLAIMIGSIYYPYPSGKHLDFWGFVALWAREIIIVGLSLLAAITLAVAWLVRLIRGKAKGD
jgi:hypothetical protein